MAIEDVSEAICKLIDIHPESLALQELAREDLGIEPATKADLESAIARMRELEANWWSEVGAALGLI